MAAGFHLVLIARRPLPGTGVPVGPKPGRVDWTVLVSLVVMGYSAGALRAVGVVVWLLSPSQGGTWTGPGRPLRRCPGPHLSPCPSPAASPLCLAFAVTIRLP